MEKTTVRNIAKHIRSTLDIHKLSRLLVKRIRETEEYKAAKTVMLFYPKKFEIDLTDLIKDINKNFCLPKMIKNELIPCCWTTETKLELSSFKVYEPCNITTPTHSIDLIILPGLCADKNRNRLGYGKGCYDKFLIHYEGVTLFPLPDELLFEQIPTAPHDIKPDIIITPSQIIR